MKSSAKAAYGWVIKQKQKRKHHNWLWGKWSYFAERTSIKNPRYLTPNHYKVKWFRTKDEAYEFYYKKLNAGFDVSDSVPMRKKIFLDAKGKYDYFKNSASLRGQRVYQ